MKTSPGRRTSRNQAWHKTVLAFLVRHRWTIGILVTLAVFAFSSIPGSVTPRFRGLDKYVHAFEYFLAGLAYLNLTTVGFRYFTLKNIIWFVVILMLVASLDEWYQTFVPQRTADWRDVVADGVGGMIALALGFILAFRFRLLPDKNRPTRD